ncbi:translocation protein TolB [Aquimixticola soesokkakensis]|uniref:Translocation protein TolB n=1 Tax=Aquimixticola soesokkakensis TaxID=1519096 RepID=A0A1Y5SPC2_9RHOB|nr:PD40 domain-containing protein [Aquimixticola soesokkakensis]SLN44712.1 translocation protein TolB [Aquimixticola soesokkakensis]
MAQATGTQATGTQATGTQATGAGGANGPLKSPQTAWKSRLNVYDFATETVTALWQTPEHIEAPNWALDGSFIVNGGGRMYRIDPANPALVPIDTGFATRCNNDHGISPDGQSLAISNHTVVGQSCIYVLPLGGGAPQQVTQNTPSWFHGWAPDGKSVTYPGVRDGQFGVFTCTLEGVETCLITSPHHYDGAEFSADGQWIWFNSDRGGGMDLWRIRRDGSALEQMTQDDRVNWFAHPRPKGEGGGEGAIYLAYPPQTQGHPADLEVELRLIDGHGATRRLCRLFGGQGTINVASWSADGRRFAFMDYARPQ